MTYILADCQTWLIVRRMANGAELAGIWRTVCRSW